MAKRGTEEKGSQLSANDAALKRIVAGVREAVRDPGLAGLRILSAAEVASILNKSKTQLETWRAQTRESGKLVGPPFFVGPSGKADGYPLVGLIDYIVSGTVWGDRTNHVLFALATNEPALDWPVTRRTLGLLMPIADALGLGDWADERESLLNEGWSEREAGTDAG